MKSMEVEMQALDDIDTIIYAAFLQFLQMIAKPGLNNLVFTTCSKLVSYIDKLQHYII